MFALFEPFPMKKSFYAGVWRLVETPLPSSISYLWNLGSLLGLSLMVQLITGVFLSYHFVSSFEQAFDSVMNIETDVWLGWVIRSGHSNGATLFFLILFAHIGRGLYFGSYNLIAPWVVGVIVIFLLMGTAFMGYVLPWGQMSYWGATVITNLLSTLPGGESLVLWVWGGFSVSGPTITRIYSFHYLLPFIVLVFSLLHISILHSTGSSNPLGVGCDSYKIPFHSFFTWKDLLGVWVVLFPFLSVVFLWPDMFMDSDNWMPANPLVTPSHIKPEWYFLFAYTILRSVDNKLGGVVGLVSSIGILLILPFLGGKSCKFKFHKQVVFWCFVGNFFLLTLVGGLPPSSESLVSLSKQLSFTYFLLIALIGFM